ncbi:hypothetical protein MGYG_04645 [Nannizzia gypsea CBS 118893]|uniref:STE24 endopeptidase n=1 Tax=Arthroderma gypseum (strain ATCC MYA-4604 / CBS 118893) TaxID=535722 RepID=E4UVY2_ARTGP|nr:hypothetical protein MGYG_04645 [Nannizzia gypsea CBS 118893]EFR01643.1 hypothetical protein MGYG_04645 [Nannizzia gypsea CBS 118893]
MPTPLDKALQSKVFSPPKSNYNWFVGLVTAAAVWSIWGSEMFPAEADPTGDPEYWTFDELRRWLRARGRLPNEQASREELLERVKANMRP